MSRKKNRFTSLVIALALTLGSYLNIGAVGNVYYVSTTGNDANSGTASAPFRTFRKAISVLTAGDTLQIYGGTYRDYLDVTKSGASGAPIAIKPVSGQQVIIDGELVRDRAVRLYGNYIVIEGIETQRALQFCVDLTGANVTVRNFTVHDCQRFGVRVKGKYAVVEGSTIYGNVLENYGGILGGSGGWPGAIRTGLGGENITLRNNNIYNNWGEGIGIGQGKFVNVLDNVVHDNYSQNIYINNSMDVKVENNFVYSVDPRYFRTGSPANCISMAEEYFDGWGAQLARIRIVNNIAAFCKRGIGYTYAEVPYAGMDTVTIAHNTIWGVTDRAIEIIDEPYKTRNSVIANNIVQQPSGRLASVDVTSGISFHHNFWVSPVSVLQNASGAGDKTGDVKMAVTPNTSPTSFRLSSSSPAIGGAAQLDVTKDFEGNTRSLAYDMGAIEYMGSTYTGSATATPIPTTSGSTGTSVNVRVAAGRDDVEETSSGTMKLGSSTLQLVYDGNNQIVGLRFNNVEIPRNANITNAYVQFKVQQTTSTSTSLSIRGQLSPNAAAFTSNSRDLSSRPRSSSSVSWSPSAWTSVGAAGSAQRTPNLAGVVQEVVNQSSWASGNSLAIIFSGSGKRVAKAYEAEAAGAPLLVVEFTSGTTSASLSTPLTVENPIASPTETAILTIPSPTESATVTSTVAPTRPSATATTYDDKDAVFSYSGEWSNVDAAGAYNGSFMKSMLPGSSVEMNFSGQSFSLLYTSNSTFGRMEVFVDGVVVGTIDQYSASRILQQRWDLPIDLAAGTHTLRLVHQGDDTTRISLDALTVYP